LKVRVNILVGKLIYSNRAWLLNKDGNVHRYVVRGRKGNMGGKIIMSIDA
jgi:hypothetical protein